MVFHVATRPKVYTHLLMLVYLDTKNAFLWIEWDDSLTETRSLILSNNFDHFYDEVFDQFSHILSKDILLQYLR